MVAVFKAACWVKVKGFDEQIRNVYTKRNYLPCYCQNAYDNDFLSLRAWFTISENHRMKASQLSEHFDFIIEDIFMKIPCRAHWDLCIPRGLIGTCFNMPHAYTYIMLIEKKLFLFLALPQQTIFLNTLAFSSAYQT